MVFVNVRIVGISIRDGRAIECRTAQVGTTKHGTFQFGIGYVQSVFRRSDPAQVCVLKTRFYESFALQADATQIWREQIISSMDLTAMSIIG